METVLKEICEDLCSDVQFEVVVANTRFTTERDQGAFNVTRVASLGTLFSCSMAPTYPLHARRIDADLVQVHLPNPLAEISALMIDRDVPVVAHFHSDIVRQQRLLRFYGPLLEKFYERASSIIVPTPRHIDVSRFVSRHRDKCRVVPFGVPLARFELDESGRKRVNDLREGPPAVLYVGRLVSYKGVEFLIRAMEDTRARLWIVGTGPMEESLKELALRRGLSGHAEFLGQVSAEELVARYHACSVFALPSITNAEMFGIVQLEAMACNKPVVSTNLPTGVSWVNQHGITGYLVPPSNSQELAKAIHHLLSNPRLRDEMGAAGRRRVEEQFTSQRMAASMFQIYHDVLHRSHVPRVAPEAVPRPVVATYNQSKRAG
jgi:rhamnosyl/mannosyltransferase